MYRNKEQLIRENIKPGTTVLDVGFVGIGVGIAESEPASSHAVLKRMDGIDLYGLDLDLPKEYRENPHYQAGNAENFNFPLKFDVIYAGDLIEHLSNCGLFLDSCRRNLKPGGIIILTTPNTFNLFSLAEKLTKREPTVNNDHTAYFNAPTLTKLLEKNNFRAEKVDYLYTLDIKFRQSFKKKVLNVLYWFLSLWTDKFIETLVIIARPI